VGRERSEEKKMGGRKDCDDGEDITMKKGRHSF
jgi:hypothetical protein